MEQPKAKVYLFKPRGKYYTEEDWIIPTEEQARAHPDLVHPGDVVSPVIMRYSPDFRRIDGGPVLVLEQEPWGYPHLFPGVSPVEQPRQGPRRKLSATAQEIEQLFAETKRSARYPEHVDGMELGHRLFDLQPDNWTAPSPPFTVAGLKRGEIIRIPSSGATDPHVITRTEPADEGRIRLRLTNLAMTRTYRTIERRPNDMDFHLRLDLLYLDDGDDGSTQVRNDVASVLTAGSLSFAPPQERAAVRGASERWAKAILRNMERDAGETALRDMAAEMRTRFEPEDVQPDTWQAGWMAATDYMDPDVDSITSTRWE